ncbi:DUF11 domain-containing protein [Curtobacterium sp. MCPF17_002]|uniref:DUF7507 domain-containing protein n=1 Tax=Curtobacterium sp. MCPF17_002 TaxID=2175645 RepID=UPI0011B4D4D0|nr:DUF11 domain-containing protein [Curtobacterium sp. MCPF17_002]WIB76984.1 DUF11 domain-containing protein [Curtobacterium sp. MCPF17_002]
MLLSGGLALTGLAGLSFAAPAHAAEPADTITKVVSFAPNGNQQTTYTVPSDALGVTVEVAGADGIANAILAGYPIASKGADITSDLGTAFNGETLNLVVGGVRAGSIPATNVGIQGGGGSYLATDDEFLAIAAGGGGGGVNGTTALVGGDGGLPSPGGTPPALPNGLQANGSGATDTAPGTLPDLTTAPNNTASVTLPQGGSGTGQGPATVVDGVITPALGGTGARSGAGGGGGYYGGGGGVSLLKAPSLVRGGGGGGSSLVGDALPHPVWGQNPATTPATADGFITFTLTLPAHPSLTATGSVTSDPVAAVGDPVTYTYTVTNNGDIDLTDIGLNVDGTTGNTPTVTCEAEALAIGASTVCTATYTATQADIDAGGIPSTVTPTGTDTNGYPAVADTIPAPVTVTPTRSLGIVAEPATTAGKKAGEEVTFHYTVTNTGTATATGVSLEQGDFTGTGDAPALSCPAGPVAPGASVECTGTYTLTQADLDADETIISTVTGTATAAGSPVLSAPAVAAQPITQSPAVTVTVKPSTDAATVGQKITYTFTVSNTGNVTVTDPTVGDIDFSGSGDLSNLSCPSVGSLAPGESVTCTATYTVTAADLQNGPLTVTAAGTATDPSGASITADPSDEITVAVAAPTDNGDDPANNDPGNSAGNAPGTGAGNDANATGTLAFTGTDLVLPGALLAIMLLALGVTVLVVGRRKRHVQDGTI